VPLSRAKLNIVTYCKNKKGILNLKNNNVCLPNRLRYSYFNKFVKASTSISSSTNNVAIKCIYYMLNR
jgi:hypothetical protein